MKTIFLLLLFAALAHERATAAQSRQIPRVGVLMPSSVNDPGEKRELEAFLGGYKELGYAPGQNVIFEYRGADQKLNLLSRLAEDLIRLNVSVIVAVGTTAVAAAIKATQNIPIVMVSGGDPVSRGFIKSSSAPGGNVTGLSSSADGDEGKRVEWLREAFPWIERVLLLNADKRRSRVENYLRQGQRLPFQTLDVFSTDERNQILSRLDVRRSDALITVRNAFTIRHGEQIAAFALKKRVPSIYESREFVEKGGLMSYGVNYTASWRRSAFYVDKVLKGANPAVLPVEPPQFEFLVNLRTANKIGFELPPEILLEANEVIQ